MKNEHTDALSKSLDFMPGIILLNQGGVTFKKRVVFIICERK